LPISKPFRLVLLSAILAIALPSLASAQIYSWRDGDGNLVLSSTPKAGAVKTFAVENNSELTIRTTRRAVSKRSVQFEPLIREHAQLNGVSADLVRAVIQAESAFNPRARSPKGAMGLMQLMPATAAVYRVRDAYDPEQNIRAGVAYLKSLLTKYENKVELALAAYNAGPGAVQKYGGTVPPYKETRNYIARIKATGPMRTPSSTRVYTSVETVDGREITRLSNTPSHKAIALKSGIDN
jgi:soluble lytic murein transglycosylase-like protein